MFKRIIVLVCAISVTFIGNVFAGTQVYTQWNGTEGGDWYTASNWTLTSNPYTTDAVPLQLDPDGGPQGAYFGKAGFKAPNLTSPGIVGAVGVDQMTVGGTAGGNLSIASGATFNISEYTSVGYNKIATAENGTLNMNGGTLNCGTKIPASGYLYVGWKGIGTVNMNSGIINLTSYLSIADQSGSTGYVHLDGGTIYATELRMNTANAHLDIRGGTLILDGNDIAAVDGFIASGKLTAYAGSGGTVQRDYNVTNAGKTTVTGYLPSPKAINPDPFNNATNVSLEAILGWAAGVGATSHDVYLDTVNPPTAFQGNQTGLTFTPSVLAPGTTYYWRIDEVSGSGTTTGDVWKFTTVPGLPTSPSPSQYMSGVAIHPTLSWTSNPAVLSHDVYFGTASPGVFQGNQTATTFDPGTLLPNVTYYWRIDEVYSTGTIAGPVWSFTVANTKASIGGSQFSPPDGATRMPVGVLVLAWMPGVGAVSHDVYLDTVNPPAAFQGNQTSTSFAPPAPLTPNTTYYWRIDEKDGSGGTTAGDVWSFTTGDPVGIYPYLTWKNDPTNSIMVNWWNPAAKGDSSVDYGLDSSYGSTANVATVTSYHHVELTSLTPATTYHYRIRSSDGTVGQDNTFKTAPDPSTTSFRFVYYGDPRTTEFVDEPYLSRQKALCDWLAQQDVDFAIEGGDIVWDGTSLLSMGKYWPDWFMAEGGLTKTKVVMHTLGNHEVQGGGTYYYWNDFYVDAFPGNGPAGTNGRLYSFDYGNAHFVSCASYQVNWEVEKTWLRADLTAAKARGAKWIFCYFHYPLYTTSGHPPRQADVAALGPIFDEFGVTIAFQSHNHVYERFTPIITYYDDVTNPSAPVWTGKTVPDGEGTVYITNGIGGAEFNNSAPDPKLVTWFGAANVNTTIATVVTINGSTCTVQAIRNDTGEVLDTYQVLPRLLKADLNRDGFIDMLDLGALAGHWLDSGIWP
jgi:hypothetical protein